MTDITLRARRYLRVSIECQAATGISLEEQEHRLCAGAERRSRAVTRVFCDDCCSGNGKHRRGSCSCIRR